MGFAVACWFLACAPWAQAAWTRELYVWQRQNGPDVTAALDEFRPLADGFHVLVAEVAWPGGGRPPAILRPPRDYARLAGLNRSIGLVLRVGPYAGPFASDDAAAKALVELARSLLAEARAARLTPSELQIDFDCAESKLDGYRSWLEALRTATGGVPLVFTALPVWLRHESAFDALARAADGFVLQVHSLEKPASPDATFTLCDPERTRAWAAQASRFGVPFRLALPTYGYLVAFDKTGRFFALAAEGARPDWLARTHVRVVRADAVAMATLARTLSANPPAHCTGIIWFRLPVAGDRLNWDARTLDTVFRGEIPSARLVLDVTWPEEGLVEITVANTGETTEPLPVRIDIKWPKPLQPIGSDGLGGFRLDVRGAEGQAVLVNVGAPPDALLAPGRRVKVAWFRFPHELPLDASFPPPSP
jgi:hypothetical protein